MCNMIENRVYTLCSDDIKELIHDASNSISTHLVEIYGKEILTWKDYIEIIEKAFRFPTQCTNNFDGYYDWMRDLDWLGKDHYVLVVHDFSHFLEQDQALKKEIIYGFNEVILPWWQEEVERCVVDGKAKSFNIYLVD